MSDYFEFVLVKHEGCDKPYLFRAPAFTHLKKGDMVVVDTKRGLQMANVLGAIDVSKDDIESINFIMEATGADTDVKKVISKVNFSELDYEEDEENGTDND